MEYIYECENFLPSVYCDHLVEKFEREGKKHIGETGGGIQLDIKRNTDVSLVHDRELWFDELAYTRVKIKQAFQKYVDYMIDNDYYNKNIRHIVSELDIREPQIQKTEKGGFYVWHYDGSAHRNRRMFTYIIYLNDVDEESGGSTEFLWKKVQPKKGKLVIFPATWTYLHRGEMLKRGEKYILIGFVYTRA